ncbi:MAG: nucleotidyltransferase [Clostridiales bacterium]|nr:nucleotidyltransferase [Clostridiales bacterium]
MKTPKYVNFVKATKRLNEANTVYRSQPDNEFYQDSLIKRFEFSFELAWKSLREYMTEQGYMLTIGSPKGVFGFAYQEGIIQSEQVWLDMLECRNQSTHDYGNDLAASLADSISNKYAKELTRLAKLISEQ